MENKRRARFKREKITYFSKERRRARFKMAKSAAVKKEKARVSK